MQDLAVLVATTATPLPAPVLHLAHDPYLGRIEAMIEEPPCQQSVSLVRLDGEITRLANERGWYVARCNPAIRPGHSGAPVFATDGQLIGIVVEADQQSGDAHLLPSYTVRAALQQVDGRSGPGEITEELGGGHNLPRVERGSLVRAHLELVPANNGEDKDEAVASIRYSILARANFTGRMRLDLRTGSMIVGVTRANLLVRDERGQLDTGTVAFAFGPGESVTSWVRAAGSEEPGRSEN
jgi:hypothetical protein